MDFSYSGRGKFYWRWKLEYSQKNSDLPQITDKLYHMELYGVFSSWIEKKRENKRAKYYNQLGIFQVVAWLLLDPILCGCLQRCRAHVSKLSADGWKIQQVIIERQTDRQSFSLKQSSFHIWGYFILIWKLSFTFFVANFQCIFLNKNYFLIQFVCLFDDA